MYVQWGNGGWGERDGGTVAREEFRKGKKRKKRREEGQARTRK